MIKDKWISKCYQKSNFSSTRQVLIPTQEFCKQFLQWSLTSTSSTWLLILLKKKKKSRCDSKLVRWWCFQNGPFLNKHWEGRHKDIWVVTQICYKMCKLGRVVVRVKAFNEAKVQVLEKRFKFGDLVVYCYYFIVVEPAAWDKRTGQGERTGVDWIVLHRSAFQKQPFFTLFSRDVSICILARLQRFMTTVVTSSIKPRSTCSVMKCRQLKKRGNNNT